MGKPVFPVSAVLFLIMALLVVAGPTCGKTSALDNLIERVDTIAVVEVISTDYTATAADGPMYAEAKILKVIKGNISRWQRRRFGETAWWDPTYKDGERRIVFLSRGSHQGRYYKTKWHTAYTGGMSFFWREDSLQDLYQESLLDFLKEIEATKKSWQDKLVDRENFPKILKLEKRFPCYNALHKMGVKPVLRNNERRKR